MGGRFREDVHQILLSAARDGRVIFFSDLPGGRGHIGAYLSAIADFEKANGRPPLTALVVRKQTNLPAEGFAIAARQVGYARLGESDHDIWLRAVRDVFTYWSAH